MLRTRGILQQGQTRRRRVHLPTRLLFVSVHSPAFFSFASSAKIHAKIVKLTKNKLGEKSVSTIDFYNHVSYNRITGCSY